MIHRQELYLIDVSTGKKEQLTNSVQENEMSPRWSPDGQKIAYLVSMNNQFYLSIIDPINGESQRTMLLPSESK